MADSRFGIDRNEDPDLREKGQPIDPLEAERKNQELVKKQLEQNPYHTLFEKYNREEPQKSALVKTELQRAETAGLLSLQSRYSENKDMNVSPSPAEESRSKPEVAIEQDVKTVAGLSEQELDRIQREDATARSRIRRAEELANEVKAEKEQKELQPDIDKELLPRQEIVERIDVEIEIRHKYEQAFPAIDARLNNTDNKMKEIKEKACKNNPKLKDLFEREDKEEAIKKMPKKLQRSYRELQNDKRVLTETRSKMVDEYKERIEKLKDECLNRKIADEAYRQKYWFNALDPKDEKRDAQAQLLSYIKDAEDKLEEIKERDTYATTFRAPEIDKRNYDQKSIIKLVKELNGKGILGIYDRSIDKQKELPGMSELSERYGEDGPKFELLWKHSIPYKDERYDEFKQKADELREESKQKAKESADKYYGNTIDDLNKSLSEDKNKYRYGDVLTDTLRNMESKGLKLSKEEKKYIQRNEKIKERTYNLERLENRLYRNEPSKVDDKLEAARTREKELLRIVKKQEQQYGSNWVSRADPATLTNLYRQMAEELGNRESYFARRGEILNSDKNEVDIISKFTKSDLRKNLPVVYGQRYDVEEKFAAIYEGMKSRKLLSKQDLERYKEAKFIYDRSERDRGYSKELRDDLRIIRNTARTAQKRIEKLKEAPKHQFIPLGEGKLTPNERPDISGHQTPPINNGSGLSVTGFSNAINELRGFLSDALRSAGQRVAPKNDNSTNETPT